MISFSFWDYPVKALGRLQWLILYFIVFYIINLLLYTWIIVSYFLQAYIIIKLNFRNLTAASSNGSNPVFFPSESSADSSPKGRGSEGEQDNGWVIYMSHFYISP